MQPAQRILDLEDAVFLPAVAAKADWTAQQQLAVFRLHRLPARQHMAYRAAHVVARHRGAGDVVQLGHAEGVDDGHPQRHVVLEQLGRHGRCAADHIARVQKAHVFAQVAIDQEVRHGVHRAVAPGPLRGDRAHRVEADCLARCCRREVIYALALPRHPAHADTERPAVQRALEPGRLAHADVHAGFDFFQDTRHSAEHGGLDLDHIGLHGVDAVGKVGHTA
ncbi:hypothetical protein D9M73_134770 [compost metagenome]